MPDGSARRNTTSVQSRIEKIERFLADPGLSAGERTAAVRALARLRAHLPSRQERHPYAAQNVPHRFYYDALVRRGLTKDAERAMREAKTDQELYDLFYARIDQWNKDRRAAS